MVKISFKTQEKLFSMFETIRLKCSLAILVMELIYMYYCNFTADFKILTRENGFSTLL